ncbi:hypothetical protein L1987_69619 [Smallanthus sonchifolius]|uniref:Uncharacterized protein n=4 Tax=Smallanthus sonchifolius TaxID=185202 RepID=A0ACB9BAT7_9ASTR|nr:hypothetical protein L1987_69619 [Smallanthus sonchifolius]
MGDFPQADPHFRRIDDTVTQVMGLAHQGHRLQLPTHLTTEPVNLGVNNNAPQTVGRRERRRGRRVPATNNEEPIVENVQQNLFDIDFGAIDTCGTNFGDTNFEAFVTSNIHQQHQNAYEADTSSNTHQNTYEVGTPSYIPQFENQYSPSGSYTDFGVSTQHQTPFMMPDISQNLSPFNVITTNQTPYQQPPYSFVSPVPLDLSLGMTYNSPDIQPENEQGNQVRNERPRRNARAPQCGTGHRLDRHHP